MSHHYNRNRPFLVIELRHIPKPTANTRVKGWMNDPDNLVMTEHVSVVDRLNAKQMTASLIIDLLDGKLLKNARAGEADDEMVIAHYVKKYDDMIKDGLRNWAAKQLANTTSE
jgi:hypothetical protein